MSESTKRTTRTQLLARVREALNRPADAPVPVPPPLHDATVRLADGEDELVAMFETRAQAVGMNVQRVSAGQFAAKLSALMKKLNAKTAALALSEKSSHFDCESILHKAGVETVATGGRERVDQQFDVDVGLTDVDAALAETGSLVVRSDAAHGRSQSLIPTHHIAIVRAADILPDMLDYWPALDGVAPKDLPSSVSLITGPSKTADIEGILITGVHGPASVDIFLVDR